MVGRYLLVLWLTMMILAGSSLCCCTPAWLGLATSTESIANCCCPPSLGEQSGCPHKPDGRKHECPCKKSNLFVSQGDSERTSVPTASSTAAGQFLASGAVASVRQEGIPAVDARRHRPGAFPYLDGRGILLAVSTLRC